jgi:hypothetical protein
MRNGFYGSSSVFDLCCTKCAIAIYYLKLPGHGFG